MVSLPGGRRGRLLSAAIVVVVLAALYGISAMSSSVTIGSSIQLGQDSGAPVTSAIRACPAPGSGGVTSGSVASTALASTSQASTSQAGTAAASPATPASGTAVISRLTPAGTPGPTLTTLSTPGILNLTSVPAAPAVPAAPPAPSSSPSAGTGTGTGTGAGTNTAVPASPGRGGVVVQATGAMAQGLEVEQAGPDGLVTLQCPAPGTDFWFIGPGITTAAHLDVYLMNTGSQPADAEVDALTDSGPLLGASDTGIIVPPDSLVTQSLGTLLRGSHALSLHVSTSVGQVAVAVRQTTGSGSDPGGWLPATQPPATSLTIPGLPGTPGPVTVYVAVPGDANASLKITAVTAKGTYQPTGGTADLPGDSAVAVQLPSLSSVPAAIRITASVPITAAAVISGGEPGAPGAISPAAAPVIEQGIAAASPAGPAGSAQLIISAPGNAATVRITTATAKVSLAGQTGTTVTVPAGQTLVESVGPPPGGGNATYSIVVTPERGSGPVYVARVVRSGGTVRTILPLTSALTLVPLPPVLDSLSAAGQSG
jgi:hypothetical protein